MYIQMGRKHAPSPENTISGSLNYWIAFCGGEALSNPPALQGVEAPTEAVVTLTPTKFTFELESEPENVQDLKLIIQASVPQSNGVTRAYSKAVQIGGVLEAVIEDYDIKEDFDNKHGAPKISLPKCNPTYLNLLVGCDNELMLIESENAI